MLVYPESTAQAGHHFLFFLENFPKLSHPRMVQIIVPLILLSRNLSVSKQWLRITTDRFLRFSEHVSSNLGFLSFRVKNVKISENLAR